MPVQISLACGSLQIHKILQPYATFNSDVYLSFERQFETRLTLLLLQKWLIFRPLQVTILRTDRSRRQLKMATPVRVLDFIYDEGIHLNTEAKEVMQWNFAEKMAREKCRSG